jgi:dihydroorotate dehydrogenase electron transfer subunit
MVQTNALVTDLGESGLFTRIALAAPEIASRLAAGRFVLADLSGYLRTPLFPARLDAEEFDVLVPPEHPAAALRPGSRVDLVGPLGCGFEIDPLLQRLLLVADVVHLPVLLPLAAQTSEGSRTAQVSVTLLMEAPTAAALYPIRLLPAEWEVHLVTADGSAGHGGLLPALFPDLARWADCICIAADPAADPALYPALAEAVRQVRINPGARFAQALVAPPLACGVGACQGCAVRTADGFKMACVAGPVFDLLELR